MCKGNVCIYNALGGASIYTYTYILYHSNEYSEGLSVCSCAETTGGVFYNDRLFLFCATESAPRGCVALLADVRPILPFLGTRFLFLFFP